MARLPVPFPIRFRRPSRVPAPRIPFPNQLNPSLILPCRLRYRRCPIHHPHHIRFRPRKEWRDHAHRTTDLYGIPKDRMGHILAYSGKFHHPPFHHQCRTRLSFSRVVEDESLFMNRTDAPGRGIRTVPFSRHAACGTCVGAPRFSRVSSPVRS